MRKDIEHPEVKNIAIAVVPENTPAGQQFWSVYFLNLKRVAVEGVLVNARGYGELDGRKKETATIRYFLDVVEAQAYRKVENMIKESTAITNQYWVSFYEGEKMFDKKYIFLPESITKNNFVNVPLLNKPGVMIL